jgi:hypothetical protein
LSICAPSQKENPPAQVGDQGKATAGGMDLKPEEKAIRDVYTRLMRYHTAARDEAFASLGVSRQTRQPFRKIKRKRHPFTYTP